MGKNKEKNGAGAVVRIVIWTLVLAILSSVFVLCTLVHAGVIDSEWLSFGVSLNLGGYTYDDADEYLVGGAELKGELTSLDINWVSGRIDIVPGDGETIVIREEYPTGIDSDDLLRYRFENGKLTVKYCNSRFIWGFGKNMPSKKLIVTVPADMLGSMQDVFVETVSADLTIEGLGAESVDVEAVSADVSMSDVVLESLDVEVVSGKVTLDGIVEEGSVESVLGAVSVTLGAAADELSLETVSGRMEVILPATIAGFEAVLDSVSGDIHVEGFDVERGEDSDTRIYLDGRMKINCDSVSGQLTIKKQTES